MCVDCQDSCRMYERTPCSILLAILFFSRAVHLLLLPIFIWITSLYKSRLCECLIIVCVCVCASVRLSACPCLCEHETRTLMNNAQFNNVPIICFSFIKLSVTRIFRLLLFALHCSIALCLLMGLMCHSTQCISYRKFTSKCMCVREVCWAICTLCELIPVSYIPFIGWLFDGLFDNCPKEVTPSTTHLIIIVICPFKCHFESIFPLRCFSFFSFLFLYSFVRLLVCPVFFKFGVCV